MDGQTYELPAMAVDHQKWLTNPHCSVYNVVMVVVEDI